MKVIIFAYAKENHTAPVKWALEQAGYEVACWGGLSWTEQQQASLLLDVQTKMTLGPYTVGWAGRNYFDMASRLRVDLLQDAQIAGGSK
jgi:hypothetical protein